VSILSLQSSVAYGHVGNAAAVFALRRLGLDVWPIDTVRFSNHPGHGRFRGRVTPVEDAEDIILGLAEAGVVAQARAVLSGYLGTAAMSRVLVDLIRRVRAADPAAVVCIDPVMGDHGRGLYVADDLVGFFRGEAIPLADVITPNHFELELLAGTPLPTMAAVVAAARGIATAGPATVVVTSVRVSDLDPGRIMTIAVDPRERAFAVATPLIPHQARGAGDLLAALFLGHRLGGRDTPDALARAVGAVYRVIEATAGVGSAELRLVATQEALVAPPPIAATVLG
jgi:pyridoxine kinase